MNSVSMPSRPVARARAASSAVVKRSPSRLVRPVAVAVEVVARAVLGAAVPVAADADAEQEVDDPDGQAGADDGAAAFGAAVPWPEDHGHHAADDHDGREPI